VEDEARRPSVLVIEDEPQIARAVRRVLESNGYETTWRERGADGLQAAHSMIPDVIILDLSLPDLDGRAVLHGLRESADTRGIPVIITSAVPEWLDSEERHLTQAILAKPFRFEQLLYAISAVSPRP
jgi:two-component system KDP operon response regulator KdpE